MGALLVKDLVVTGKLEADLYTSTSGTDSDFLVKVIDVFPEDAEETAWKADAGPAPGQNVKSLNGRQHPIAMEVRRGRHLKSFEEPKPLQSGVPVLWNILLRDRGQVFRKGHRISVQVQSTWFPLTGRRRNTFRVSIRRRKRISSRPRRG